VLDIIVENQGRIAYGPMMNDNRKVRTRHWPISTDVLKCPHEIRLLPPNAAEKKFGKGVGNTTWGLEDRSLPVGSRDTLFPSPVRGLGDEFPQKLKNFQSSYKQILRIFW